MRFSETFAEKIRKLRKRLGITQTQLAKLLKTSQSAIACWETGITACRVSKLPVIEKLCSKKGIRINWRR
jgi:transcriptional regulator with XRE-family HTH domain